MEVIDLDSDFDAEKSPVKLVRDTLIYDLSLSDVEEVVVHDHHGEISSEDGDLDDDDDDIVFEKPPPFSRVGKATTPEERRYLPSDPSLDSSFFDLVSPQKLNPVLDIRHSQVTNSQVSNKSVKDVPLSSQRSIRSTEVGLPDSLPVTAAVTDATVDQAEDDCVIILESDDIDHHDIQITETNQNNSFMNQALQTSQLSEITELMSQNKPTTKRTTEYEQLLADIENDRSDSSDDDIEFEFFNRHTSTQYKPNSISKATSTSSSVINKHIKSRQEETIRKQQSKKVENSKILSKLAEAKKSDPSAKSILSKDGFMASLGEPTSVSSYDQASEQSSSTSSTIFSASRSIPSTVPSTIEKDLDDEPVSVQKTSNKVNRYNKYSDQQLMQYLKEVKLSNPKLLKEVNKIARSKAEFLPSIRVSFQEDLYDELFGTNPPDSLLEPMAYNRKRATYPIIVWKRQITAEYLFEKHLFVPVPEYTFVERTIILHYNTDVLVTKLENDELEGIFENLKSKYGDDITIVLAVNGLDAYFQKMKTALNNSYRTAVRQQLGDDITSNSGSNKRAKTNAGVASFSMSQEEIMERLSDFSVLNGVRIFPVKGANELCEWLKSFAFAMAQSVTEKSHLYDEFSNIGKVRSGDTGFKAYIESIKQIKGISESVATKFCQNTASFQNVLKLLRICGCDFLTDADGAKLLRSDCETRLRKLLSSTNPDDLING